MESSISTSTRSTGSGDGAMTNEQPAWPNEHIALDAAVQWIASACARKVEEPPEILQIKRWGVTARFGSVVLKASFTPLFPQVTDVHALLERIVPEGAPRLIASEMVDGQLWTLFEHLQGATAEEVGTIGALEAMARELARVQAAVAKLNLSRLPISAQAISCAVADFEGQGQLEAGSQ